MLKVKILLDKNDAVLLTQRIEKETLDAYLSNLAGSILGILGTIGFLMNLVEEKYENYIRKRKKIRNYRKVCMNHKQIFEKNFITNEKRLSKSNSASFLSILRPYIDFLNPYGDYLKHSSSSLTSKRDSLVIVKV